MQSAFVQRNSSLAANRQLFSLNQAFDCCLWFIILRRYMEYEALQMEPFPVIGISVRTTNRYGRSAADISALWKRFYAEEVRAQIPGKRTDDLYCVYSEYDPGAEEGYTTWLGCRVSSLENKPEKLSGILI